MYFTEHIVTSKDTLWGLSRKYGCTVNDIVAANKDKIKNPDIIVDGWVLKIPVPKASDTSETIRAQFRAALNDVQNLQSVKKLLDVLG